MCKCHGLDKYSTCSGSCNGSRCLGHQIAGNTSHQKKGENNQCFFHFVLFLIVNDISNQSDNQCFPLPGKGKQSGVSAYSPLVKFLFRCVLFLLVRLYFFKLK